MPIINPGSHPLITHHECIPGRDAAYGRLKRPLSDLLEAYLTARGIHLYTHQCTAIDAVRAGRDVILTTPTASGKSLAFLLPIFESLCSGEETSALCLYPAKALAHDQLSGFRALEGFTGFPAGSAVYDGDTPAHLRPRIREESAIVLSNPHELHHVLAWHPKWAGFFEKLRFVVIDEAHRYRGVFGTHVAFLLRRLLRIAERYGSRPQFILSTATIANPGEFAMLLTGRTPVVVDDDGSPRGERHFLLANPGAIPGRGVSLSRAVRDLLLASVENGLQTLCFAPSRIMAEAIARQARAALVRNGGTGESIAAYRAGYLPEERRALEKQLRDGSLSAVVSTNALELGIDVGSLDSVIMAGYPGSIMAAWQQAGRAGRRGNASWSVLVASENALDQYFVRHPESFFEKPCEHAILDPTNPYILAGHLLCAAAEAPLAPDGEAHFFGTDACDAVRALADAGILAKTRKGWAYAGRGRASEACPLGPPSGESFRVSCNGRVLETLDRNQAFREAHPGAILLHQGETYVVTGFDLDNHSITVRPDETDCHTRAHLSVDMSVIRTRASRTGEGGTLCFGDVRITEQYRQYQLRRYDTVLETHPLTLPPLVFTTRALWVTLPDTAVERLLKDGMDIAGGLHGAEHELIAMMPVRVLCDRRDIGGFSTPWHPDTAAATILIYDGYEGGIGLAEKAYSFFPSLAGIARDVVRDCPCTSGCPSCIHSPKCGNDNRPLDKAGTERILTLLGEGWQALSPDRETVPV
jgi:DEAD/DEAH box helicase domain-containing protein